MGADLDIAIYGKGRPKLPLSQFLLLFLPVLSIVLFTGYSFVESRANAQIEATNAHDRTRLHQFRGFLRSEVGAALNDIRSLVDESPMREAIDDPTHRNLSQLAETFLILAKRNPLYQQVRWIDESGFEQVRINNDGNRPSVVSTADLQNKRDRYYFAQAATMQPGELYVSPLDLNVEQGQLETPPRSVLRVAAPVSDSVGRRRGILVINIAANPLIESIANQEQPQSGVEYFLVDQEGQTLDILPRGQASSLALDPKARFPTEHPEAWNRIRGTGSGSLESVGGYWTWTTLSPADGGPGSVPVLPASRLDPSGSSDEKPWLKLVAFRSVASLIEMRRDARMPITIGAVLLLSLFGLSLAYYIRGQISTQRAEVRAAHALADAANMRKLKELDGRFRLLVESSSVGLILVGSDGRIVLSNPAAESIFGYPAGGLAELSVDSLLSADMARRHAELRTAFVRRPETRKMGWGRELQGVRRDGRVIPIEVGLNPFSENGNPMVLASIIDLSERKAVAEAMAERSALQEQFGQIMEAVPGVICSWQRDPDGSCRMPVASPALRGVCGLEPQAVQEDVEPLMALVHPDDRKALAAAMDASAETLTLWNSQYRILHPANGERWIECWATPRRQEDGTTVWYGYLQDVSEQRNARDEMQYLATHDGLTGLANRETFQELVIQALALARRENSVLAVLFLDLDNFKTINDSLGHSTGDLILKETAQRLGFMVREADTIARLGGDEFAILLYDASLHQVEEICARIIETLAETFRALGHELYTTVSVGVSLYPDHGGDCEALLRQADAAMYSAKHAGKNRFRVFTPDMVEASQRALTIEKRLRRAISERLLRVVYQPKMALADGRMAGVEALVRWTDAELSDINPEEFIPLAERCGLIGGLGRFVVERVLADIREWARAGFFPGQVSINVSALQFLDANFAPWLIEQLGRSGVAADRIMLEITETALMERRHTSMLGLNQLAKAGIAISVDDFGTGYSSLAYLRMLPLQELKIDRGFIAGIGESGNDGAITQAICNLSRTLGLQVVAEGIENENQLTLLKGFGCDCGQGRYLYQPMSAQRLLEQGRGATAI